MWQSYLQLVAFHCKLSLTSLFNLTKLHPSPFDENSFDFEQGQISNIANTAKYVKLASPAKKFFFAKTHQEAPQQDGKVEEAICTAYVAIFLIGNKILHICYIYDGKEYDICQTYQDPICLILTELVFCQKVTLLFRFSGQCGCHQYNSLLQLPRIFITSRGQTR